MLDTPNFSNYSSSPLLPEELKAQRESAQNDVSNDLEPKPVDLSKASPRELKLNREYLSAYIKALNEKVGDVGYHKFREMAFKEMERVHALQAKMPKGAAPPVLKMGPVAEPKPTVRIYEGVEHRMTYKQEKAERFIRLREPQSMVEQVAGQPEKMRVVQRSPKSQSEKAQTGRAKSSIKQSKKPDKISASWRVQKEVAPGKTAELTPEETYAKLVKLSKEAETDLSNKLSPATFRNLRKEIASLSRDAQEMMTFDQLKGLYENSYRKAFSGSVIELIDALEADDLLNIDITENPIDPLKPNDPNFRVLFSAALRSGDIDEYLSSYKEEELKWLGKLYKEALKTLSPAPTDDEIVEAMWKECTTDETIGLDELEELYESLFKKEPESIPELIQGLEDQRPDLRISHKSGDEYLITWSKDMSREVIRDYLESL